LTSIKYTKTNGTGVAPNLPSAEGINVLLQSGNVQDVQEGARLFALLPSGTEVTLETGMNVNGQTYALLDPGQYTYEMEEFFEKPFKIEYIPNCSHWVHLEQPDKVACLIKKFIAAV
jgi:hypothetical protein